MLLIPVIALVQLLFGASLAILVSAINVFYRDIGNLSRHLMRFWFYLSPTLYGVEMVEEIAGKHELIALWFKLNPWTYLLGSYRDVIYYGRAPEWAGLGLIALVSVFLLAFSIWFFKRVEPAFAKVL